MNLEGKKIQSPHDSLCPGWSGSWLTLWPHLLPPSSSFCSLPATLLSLLFFKHKMQAPTSGPFHLLFSAWNALHPVFKALPLRYWLKCYYLPPSPPKKAFLYYFIQNPGHSPYLWPTFTFLQNSYYLMRYYVPTDLFFDSLTRIHCNMLWG